MNKFLFYFIKMDHSKVEEANVQLHNFRKSLNNRFDKSEEKVDTKFDEKMESIDIKVAKLGKRLDKLEKEIDLLSKKYSK